MNWLDSIPGGTIRHHHDHSHDNDQECGAENSAAHHHHGGGHSHTHKNTKAVLNRLSKVIGHLNAVRNMVEDGRDCSEVLVQLAAVRSAINGTCKVIIKDHIDHCIVDAVNTGDVQTIEELNKAIEMLMK